MANYQKTFIIDTNVILHDPLALTTLSENNTNLLVIPIIVLEELDKFKSGTNLINYNAREFIRKLEKGDISIKVDILNYKFPDTIPLENTSGDNKILACAYNYKGKNSYFVTKDINLRMKARAIGLIAQDYKYDKVEDTKYTGYSTVYVNSDVINTLCNTGSVTYTESGIKEELISNQYLLLTDVVNDKHTALGIFNTMTNSIKHVIGNTASGIAPKNLEQTFALDALLNPYIPLVALTGISGSGKTLLSLAAAIQNKKFYQQIYITRSIVPVGNDIGYLPGMLEDKMKPYLAPFYDNLNFLKTINGNKEKIEHMTTNNKIEIAPITYSRGRSIPKVFLISDESQNLSPHEAKTLITRAGEGTKVVLMGDMDQIDTPYLDRTSNGLAHTIHKFTGQEMFAYVHLKKGERSELAELASRIM